MHVFDTFCLNTCKNMCFWCFFGWDISKIIKNLHVFDTFHWKYKKTCIKLILLGSGTHDGPGPTCTLKMWKKCEKNMTKIDGLPDVRRRQTLGDDPVYLAQSGRWPVYLTHPGRCPTANTIYFSYFGTGRTGDPALGGWVGDWEAGWGQTVRERG